MNEANGNPTTNVQLGEGQPAKVTGAANVQLQPGSKVEPGDANMAGMPMWLKIGETATASSIILGLFVFSYFRQEARFDEAMAQINANTVARAADLQSFRDWTEARQDKAQAREDEMRNRLWMALSGLTIDLKFVLLKLGVYDKATETKKGMAK